MEGLMEFIFGNLFFVLLILGALFNFFLKGKAQQEQPKRRPNRPEEEIDWQEIFKHEQEQTEHREQRAPEPVRMEKVPHVGDNSVRIEPMPGYSVEMEHKRQELERKRKLLEKKRAKAESPIVAGDITKSGLDLEFSHLTNEDAKRGIIWAEVLGKPRAKRPHNTFRS